MSVLRAPTIRTWSELNPAAGILTAAASGWTQSAFLLFQNAIEECDTAAVTSLIQSHLPEAYLKEDIGGELVYVLPPFKSTVSGAYQALLRALDTSLSDLHLGCYGISNTTVEEVGGGRFWM